jgi:hypothetical protein
VRRRRRNVDVHPRRSVEFMCMRRGPDLKLLLLVLKAVVVVMMATVFSKKRTTTVEGGDRHEVASLLA